MAESHAMHTKVADVGQAKVTDVDPFFFFFALTFSMKECGFAESGAQVPNGPRVGADSGRLGIGLFTPSTEVLKQETSVKHPKPMSRNKRPEPPLKSQTMKLTNQSYYLPLLWQTTEPMVHSRKVSLIPMLVLPASHS
ncbi:hypothetical protein ACFX11_030206 [Malus domestica]